MQGIYSRGLDMLDESVANTKSRHVTMAALCGHTSGLLTAVAQLLPAATICRCVRSSPEAWRAWTLGWCRGPDFHDSHQPSSLIPPQRTPRSTANANRQLEAVASRAMHLLRKQNALGDKHLRVRQRKRFERYQVRPHRHSHDEGG